MMASKVSYGRTPEEFHYTVEQIHQGFIKLGEVSFEDVEFCKEFSNIKLQEWTVNHVTKALVFLSKHILNPFHTSRILFLFEPCSLEIIRYALASDAHYQTKCSMLRIVFKFKPDIFHHFLSFFDNKNAPWESEPEDSKKPKKKKLTDPNVTNIEIVESCWIFLKTCASYFRTKWNWGDFIEKYLSDNDEKLRWITCQCMSIVLDMNEHNKMRLIHKYFSNEKHYEYLVEYELERQSGHSLAFDTLDFDLNPSRPFEPLFKQDVGKLTVNVAGVLLPIFNSEKQKREGCLVETKSTLNNLRKIAIGISTGKAVCLAGPVGCGKTSLVSHLALITGRNETKDLLKVQLGEETDSKLLLGTYQCTDVPGEFVWLPGMLTKALLEGHWLLLEDIGSATSDVAALLSGLLEENSITIPGFKDKVQPAPGFHLFMTHRLVNNQGYNRKEAYNTELLERHWVKVNLEPLSKAELIDIIQIKYPVLKTVATRMVSVYLLFSEGNHEGEATKIHYGSRLISTRDLFKWCSRAMAYFVVTSIDSTLKVLQDAIDIFCCSHSDSAARLELSGQIAVYLGILKPKAEHFCTSYKPNVTITQTSCIAGRGVLPRLDSVDSAPLKSLTEGMKYALTRTSCCLLERLAVCLSLNEPALLVGETGTGKTTTLQILAKQTGHTLVVINMNQQSDSSDLLGGYKPVDVKNIMMSLRDEFEVLFRSFFNIKENLQYLENISVCITKRKWAVLLKLMLQSQKAAIKRLTDKKDVTLMAAWQQLGIKIHKLQLQIKNNQAAMAFSFVEGALIHAMRNGYWVLLDEINLASAETLQCLSGLLEGSEITLLERGDEKSVPRDPDFRIMAAMNPATDFGKKDLPPGIRNRFTELFVSEHTEENDLILVANCYLPDYPTSKVKAIVDFYLNVRKKAVEILSDGLGYRPHYSLRTLCRALVVASENKCGSMARSLYEALCLSFLTQLNATSYKIVRDMIAKTVADETDIKSILKQPIPEPNLKDKFISFEGYWVAKGKSRPISSPNYIFTTRVRRNLCDLARITALSSHPILIQGETSVGKTSLIINMAGASGHKVFRINNHQHTDLQEYIGSYSVDAESGGLIFREGVLAQAMRNGDWIILDELNLAPSEVLEALNRVLDDNRELFIPETSVTIKAHSDFRIFATQNPPGTYGGRKVLSRAFRNRFVELHFDAIPPAELEEILHLRCQMPLSYCKKLVGVMSDLQLRRKGSATFAGKQGFITLRDLFRWGERYRRANSMEHLKYYDWDQHVANEGYLILAGRVRKEEEREIIKDVIEKRFKRVIDLNSLFTLNEKTSLVTKHILEKIVASPLPKGFEHLVWTFNLRVLAVLAGKAIEFQEPILLVGETGCGKTTICQLLAVLNNQLLYSVNCHQHSEGSDFLGGLRPVREKTENNLKLFEWVDGPLIKAMKEGQLFLADEISLADDSVLERLNSLLEPERKLLVSEKGTEDDIEITAEEQFHFIGTMNPGGDFGKKELSPALRNRLTEIWCEGTTNSDDIENIVEHNIRPGIVFGDCQDDNTSGIGKAIVQFINWFQNTDFGKRIPVSVRDVLLWVNFINQTEGPYNENKIELASAYIYGAFLTFIDGVGAAQTSTDNYRALELFKNSCLEFLLGQANAAEGESSVNLLFTPGLVFGNIVDTIDSFGVHPFYVKKAERGLNKEKPLYHAPTVLLNLLRLMRALHVSSRAVLLEGSPGVGKTTLVLLIAKLTKHKVTRINLSEQTDISDLFGADLPVEGAEAGTFAWKDGPFLSALKNGHWILLDELNLASQSVIEGLNSVLDHRGEIYIPELGRTFKVDAGRTKLFACQNPQREGGARKGLPQSFLNRFAKVFFEPLIRQDMEHLMLLHFPNTGLNMKRLVEFHCQVTSNSKSWASPGYWEFNLRDLIRWGETFTSKYQLGVAVETIYAARMPAEIDRKVILNMYYEVFEDAYPLTSSISPILLTPKKLIIGDITIPRETGEDYYDSFNGKDPILMLRSQQRAFKSLALCVQMGWMAILVGKSGSGKTSLVHAMAHLTGKKLHTISVSSVMDTTDLLGGFEQVDYWRHLDRIGQDVEKIVKYRMEKLLLHAEEGLEGAVRLYTLWHRYLGSGLSLATDYTLEEAEQRFRKRSQLLGSVLEALPVKSSRRRLMDKLAALNSKVSLTGLQGGGIFEWVDSTLIKCLESGEWLLLDNVNLCSGAVLDRLNSLLERQGALALGERGEADQVINPHPNFRLFLTVNPKHGHVSRSMRNRGVEIYMELPDVKNIHPCDLEALLFKHGVKLSTHKDVILDIHQKVVDQEIGPEEPGLYHLLEVVYSAERNQKQGFPFHQSLEQAFLDVYVKSRNLTSLQRETLDTFLRSTFVEKKEALREKSFTSVDCFWPEYKTPSTFYLQEDSLFGIAKQHGALLFAILRNFQQIGVTANWPRLITVRDVIGEHFSNEMSEHINLDCNILELLLYLVSTFFSCATHHDVATRALWLDQTIKLMKRIQPRLKGHEVYEKMIMISDIVSQCIVRFNLYQKDIPWDMRQVTSCHDPNENEWSFENKMITLIYYRFMCKTANEEGGFSSHKDWRIMSALEYSRACQKGQIDDWPLQMTLIKNLYSLLMTIDEVVTSGLSSNEVELPDDRCAQLIYNIAWRFKLSNAARRRLFLTNDKDPLLPLVNDDTISLLELHYGWFKKHTFPTITKIMGKSADEVKNGTSLSKLMEEIDDSLNFAHTSLLPVARKFKKTMLLPRPMSCPNQCDYAKVVKSFDDKVGLWNAAKNNIVDKTNYLASSIGQETRQKIIQVSLTIHENKDISSVPNILKDLESSMSSTGQLGIKEATTVKLWPLLELVCLQLNSAMRKVFFSTVDSNETDLNVINSAGSWYKLTDSVPPIAAALIQRISSHTDVSASKENVELNYFLFDHLNRSIGLTTPLTWLNWAEVCSLNEDDIVLNNKALYSLHTPLYSLFLSHIFSNSSKKEDTPTFALKSHKNTKRLFHLIKLLLWRNLPSIFSTILDSSENELLCIRGNYTKLVQNLTTVVASKIKDAEKIEGGEDLQRVFGRLKLELEEIMKTKGGLLPEYHQQRRPEKGITSCIAELYKISTKATSDKGHLDKWLACGTGWAYLGFVKLKLFSLLELVDPVKKKAIKMQYMSEEVSELHKLLSAEELMKITIGAPLSWPLKDEHEHRIRQLNSKYKGFDQSVAVRPAVSLYSDIVKDVGHLVNILVSDDIFNSRLNNIINLNKHELSKEQKENLVAETRSWLLSINHYQERLHNQYYLSYPDIIGPVLMSLAQIQYGIRLALSAAEKEMKQLANRGSRSINELLEKLIVFPIADLKTAQDVIEHCSDNELINLLNKYEETEEHSKSQDNKIRLIKICIRLIKTLSRSYAMDKVKNTLFLILEHVVTCWNQIQEQEKVKKAQEDSIYINRMKLTEEEEDAREISQLFPSSRDNDFGDLEVPVSLDAEPIKIEKIEENPLKLRSNEIEEICHLHSLIVREQARSHWMSRETVAEDNFIALLNDRLSVFSTLINGFYGSCENQLDQLSIGSFLLAADLQGVDAFSLTKENAHYNFYRDTNISESKQCIPLLNAIQKRINELLVEWPDHPTLQQITIIIERVTGFSMSSPLSRFLTGLELLLTKLHHWEENAHSGVSLAQHSASLTNQIIGWRKLELSAWKGALHSTFLKCEERARKWWFYLFSIITAYIRNSETDSLAEETADLVKSLQGYMETSSLGEFSTRLDLLYTFHCHTFLFPPSERQCTVSRILWNLYSFYKLFKNNISKTIQDLSTPVEKKLKDFVKIARWNDINYWSIKSAVEKTHHTLLKHIKEYEKILNEPARGAMFKTDIPKVTIKLNLSSLVPTNFLTSLQMAETYKDIEKNENLLARLSSLFKRSNIICKQTMSNCEYSKLLDNFELLVEEVEESGKLISEFDIDTTIEKERRKSVVKSLLQRKRKTVSDLFRTLTQIGLSYRSGLLMFEQNNTAFTSLSPIDIEAGLQQIDRRKSDKDWLKCWKGSEQYFYTSVARLAMLKIALEKPHKDLGPQFIERIKGFTSHSNSLLHLLKETLGNSSKNIYVIRCQIAQLLKLKENNYGLVNCLFENNKQLLKNVFEDIVYCLRQFIVLLDACPEVDVQLTDVDQIPTIFTLPSGESMVNAFKYDIVWETTKSKVQSLIKKCLKMQDDISVMEKHRVFVSSFNETLNTDIFINRSEYNLVEDCFQRLSDIVEEICKLQKLFNQPINEGVLTNPLVRCLDTVVANINNTLEQGKAIEFPSDKTISIESLLEVLPVAEKEKLETFINKILCIIQNVYKKHLSKNEDNENPVSGTESSPKEPLESVEEKQSQTDSNEEIIVDGHLKEKLVESLISDFKLLRISEVSNDLNEVYSSLIYLNDETIKEAIQGLLLYLVPLLDQLVSFYHYFNVQLTGACNILGKFSSSLLSLFTEFGRNGYNIPEEIREEIEGEGETKKGGLGLGEGEGEKDVSDQIESEDQLEDARKPGEYGQDEDKDCKEEEKGIEMSEDFGGKLQDIEKKDDDENNEDKDGDDEKEEEPDKEMGETEKGADTLDKQVWGSDSEEEPEDDQELPKDEKGNKGAEQSEKQLGAGEEEKETVDDKENEPHKKEPKEKEINEMNEPEVDDDQIDPYHGKQQPSPEVEPLELPDDEDMAVDEDEDKGSEGEDDKENPFDIDVMKKNIEEEKPQEEDKSEEKDKTEETNTQDNPDEDDEHPNPELKKPDVEPEEENTKEEEEETEGSKQDEADGKVEEEMEEKVGTEEVSGTDEKPTEQDVEKSASKDGSKDQVKNNEDLDVNMDTDPEESKAQGREETGAGRAEKEDMNTGGHKGTAGKRKNAGESEMEEKKHKPGQSEIERSLGNVDEPLKKRLKTIGIQKETESKEEMETEENRLQEDSEADLYQHIHEANKTQHDAQTVDSATQEQVEKQMPVIGKENEDAEKPVEDEIIELSEDEEMIDVEAVDEMESAALREKENEDKRKKEKGEGGGLLDEATIEVDGEYSSTYTVSRGYQTTFHTLMSETEKLPLSEAEMQMLRQQLEQQFASWNTKPILEEAAEAWEKICAVTSSLAQQLSEELRLVLEPTTASSLKGDFRTGKRINMRKVIPYIASQFRKDKIWLRRTKPSKREYQIILAIDDSSSMADNHSKELAFESLAVVSKALNLLEAGDLAVISFGEVVKVLHQLGETFTENSGARLMQEFSFDEKKTRVAAAVETALGLVSQRGPDSAQLLVIISDGRGIMSEGESVVRSAVRKANHARLFIVFIIIDNPLTKDSILDIRLPTFKGPKVVEIKPYMDAFPFPFYLILRDINSLPSVLSDALRQWFELVTDMQ